MAEALLFRARQILVRGREYHAKSKTYRRSTIHGPISGGKRFGNIATLITTFVAEENRLHGK